MFSFHPTTSLDSPHHTSLPPSPIPYTYTYIPHDPQQSLLLTFVITFHTLPTPEIRTLIPDRIPHTPQLVLAILITVHHAICAIEPRSRDSDTAEGVHVAVAGTGGLVGGLDVAVFAIRARVDVYARASLRTVFGAGGAQEGKGEGKQVG